MTRRDIDTPDIQAIAKTGFASLKAASYMLLRVVENQVRAPVVARSCSRQYARPAEVKKILELEEENSVDTYQIAFTAAGLRKLGVDRIDHAALLAGIRRRHGR